MNDAASHPNLYHQPASHETPDQQRMMQSFYDTPQGGWGVNSQLPSTLPEDTLMSPFESTFDQVTTMGELHPVSDTQGGKYPQTFPGDAAHYRAQQWNGHSKSYPPKQTYVSLYSTSWSLPSPAIQDVATSLSFPESNMPGFQAPTYGHSGQIHTLGQSECPTTSPYHESRTSTKGKGKGKRRKASVERSDKKEIHEKHAREPKSKSQRVSVVTPIKEEPSPYTPLVVSPPQSNCSFSTRPSPSRQLSGISTYPSQASLASPATSFPPSIRDPTSPDSNDENMTQAKTVSQRERNRAAATKCRAKNKRAMNNLEETSRKVTEQRELLSAYATSLKDEVLALKNELLRHSDCDCVIIQTYLHNMARHVGEGKRD